MTACKRPRASISLPARLRRSFKKRPFAALSPPLINGDDTTNHIKNQNRIGDCVYRRLYDFDGSDLFVFEAGYIYTFTMNVSEENANVEGLSVPFDDFWAFCSTH